MQKLLSVEEMKQLYGDKKQDHNIITLQEAHLKK